MSSDVFVYVAREQAPAETQLHALVATMERVEIDIDMLPASVWFEPGKLAYVEAIVGPFRLDAIPYRGGTLHHVVELLERCYAPVTALADCDTDGIFPIPELVHLMRALGEQGFDPWADPAKRHQS